ncbi:PKD domain-containing protein [bacterium]|nr:PKD domain-containing protein [bacterium]
MSRDANVLIALLGIILISCASESSIEDISAPQISPEQILAEQSPVSLPADGVQPWEQLDASGHVIPAERSASSININTDFTLGVERFSDSGDAVDNLDATRLNGTDSTGTSYAMYRVSMGSGQPGIVSVDANLLSGKGYYVGLSDYGSGRWDWHGPFTDNHVRLQAVTNESGDLTSTLGNTFVSVLCPAGTSIDVVGVGVNQFDPVDTTAPTIRQGLTATPVPDGLLLEWIPVLDFDLAGYVVYHSRNTFTDPQAEAVSRLPYLEGSVRHVLTGLDGLTFVRVAAVDFSGNESLPSEITSAEPLASNQVSIQVGANKPSAGVNDAVILNASGADSYDWDLDGDGVFEIASDASGMQAADTSATGIVRPRILGRGSDGEYVALGGLSLIISGNTRPVASATAAPQSGPAPLDVTFSGEAEDTEDTVGELTFAWDFDGDGIYEPGSDTLTPSVQNYAMPGLFNAKLRVTDTAGAWDVDTVAVIVQETSQNVAPIAAIRTTQLGDSPEFSASFSADNSADIDGSIEKYEWDWDNDAVFDDDTGTNPAGSHDFLTGGSYTVVVRVTDDDGSTDTAAVDFSFIDNLPPVAIVTVNTLSGEVPLTVEFDAGSSTDLDGSIVQYEWDWEGDGVYDENAGTYPSTEHSYTELGVYKATLRVTDDDGAIDTAQVTISLPGITTTTIDVSSNVGLYTSLATVDGTPAISYYDITNDDLKFVRAVDAQGSAWGTPVNVDTGALVGRHTSLEIVDGNPAISYYKQTNADLRYVRATDAQGGSWGSPVGVDTAGSVGEHTSLAVIDGNPAISYYDSTNKDLKYVRAADAQGSIWGTPLAVDTDGTVGYETSLAVVDGNPAISYYDNTNSNLKYVRASDAQGSGWGAPLSVDTDTSVGRYSSMVVVNGNPAITYYDESNFDLKYVRASDAQGGSWGTPIALDTAGDVGYFTSLSVVNGKPAVSYQDNSNSDLKYIRATDLLGETWGTPVAIDSAGDVGKYTSLAVVDGYAAISYYDDTNNGLKFAIIYE